MTEIRSSRKQRFEEAREAGKLWAKQQLGDPVETGNIGDVRDMIEQATAAYIATKTGRLPVLHFTSIADHEADVDYGSGFDEGANEVVEAVSVDDK